MAALPVDALTPAFSHAAPLNLATHKSPAVGDAQLKIPLASLSSQNNVTAALGVVALVRVSIQCSTVLTFNNTGVGVTAIEVVLE